jgi:DNA polymerase gamma 1
VIDGQVVRPPASGKLKVLGLLGNSNGFPVLQSGHELALSIASGDQLKMSQKIHRLSKGLSQSHSPVPSDNPWLRQTRLDACGERPRATGSSKPPQVLWPKLYWELAKPKKDLPPRAINSHTMYSYRACYFSCPGKVGLSSTLANTVEHTALYQVRRKQLERTRLR